MRPPPERWSAPSWGGGGRAVKWHRLRKTQHSFMDCYLAFCNTCEGENRGRETVLKFGERPCSSSSLVTESGLWISLMVYVMFQTKLFVYLVKWKIWRTNGSIPAQDEICLLVLTLKKILLMKDLRPLFIKVLNSTEVAGEGGTNWAPEKFLSSQQFRHFMRCTKHVNKFVYHA